MANFAHHALCTGSPLQGLDKIMCSTLRYRRRTEVARRRHHLRPPHPPAAIRGERCDANVRRLQRCNVCTQGAHKVFGKIPLTYKDAADWTALMDCCSGSEAALDALSLFVAMRMEGVPIDDIAMVLLFGTCAKLGNSVFAIQGHACMIKMGLGFAVKARNTAMDMYVKCGLMDSAKMVFGEMPVRNVVSWTVLLWGVMKWEGLENGKNLFDEMPEMNEIAWTIMIARHVENGFTREAFKLLTEMVFGYGLYLDSTSSLCSILSACTQSGDVVMGKRLHSYALRDCSTPLPAN